MPGPIYRAVRHSSKGSIVSVTGSVAPSVRSKHSSASTLRSVTATPPSPTSSTAPTLADPNGTGASDLTKSELRAATRGRQAAAIGSAALFLVSLMFLILLNVGNTSNHHVLGDMYFLKLDTTSIIPASVPKANLMNPVARTIGLHDFYQVGMWNFCEGYNVEGITACSKPTAMYWFNPVQIILDELLNGATVAIPDQVAQYLSVLRRASQITFAFFFTSTLTSFIAIFLCPLAVHSRLVAAPIAFFATVSASLTLAGACIASAMWTIFRNAVLAYRSQLNIGAVLGGKMFAFMWMAALCALAAAVLQCGLVCCGTSRRQVTAARKVGRRVGAEKHVVEEDPAMRRRWWGSVSEDQVAR